MHRIRSSKLSTALYLAAFIPLVMLLAFGGQKLLAKRALQRSGRHSAPTLTGTLCRPGPWGRIQYVRLNLSAPPTLASPGTLIQEFPRGWFFRDKMQTDLPEIFRQLGIRETTVKRILTSRIVQEADGTRVRPPPNLITSMPEEDRGLLYEYLSRTPDNPWHYHAVAIPSSELDAWSSSSGLSPITLGRLRTLLYTRGPISLLADIPLLLMETRDPAEQQRITTALAKRKALQVELILDHEQPSAELIRYWSRGLSAKDLTPLLKGLSRIPKGHRLDVSHLIPPLARQRLNQWTGCSSSFINSRLLSFQTALGFFGTPLLKSPQNEDQFFDMINALYHPVDGRKAMGDILIFITPAHSILHTCVWVADSVVYTKGPGRLPSPWMLMHIDDLRKALGAHPRLHERTFLKRDS